jgi:hypothetical protein
MTVNDCVIYAYTRKQALADGVLVDAGERYPRMLGFKVPVAFTAAAWADAIVREGKEDLQSEEGRVWDVLCFLLAVLRTKPAAGPALRFEASQPSARSEFARMTLKAVIGPDDDGNPCLTIMLPDED